MSLYSFEMSSSSSEAESEIEITPIQFTTTEITPPAAKKTKSRNLSNIEKQNIAEFLLKLYDKGKMKWGAVSDVATKFNCSRQTVSSIWRTAKNQIRVGAAIDVRSKMAGRVGRKKIIVDLTKIMGIPLRNRRNIRSLANAMGVPKSTCHRWVTEGQISACTSAIKPFLTKKNEMKRLEFCLSYLDQSTMDTNPKFQDCYNTIHIDEKWFYLTKETIRYYKHPNEDEQKRQCKSKGWITKVMFMAAVARPIFGDNGQVLFDGKIGIFPFIVEEPAKRTSINRDRGTMVTKAITSVTRVAIRDCILKKVIPSVKAKWPDCASKSIVIQQDNARPHILPNDPDFVKAATEEGWDFTLVCQPPNSPDMNVLDLGFFNAIQALQQENPSKDIVELVEAVDKSFKNLQPMTLNKVWLSLQYCMVEIMKEKGSIHYKMPHVGKDSLLRQGLLPTVVTVDAAIVTEVKEFITAGVIETPQISQAQNQATDNEFITEEDDLILLQE